jgi:hypothetical protein
MTSMPPRAQPNDTNLIPGQLFSDSTALILRHLRRKKATTIRYTPEPPLYPEPRIDFENTERISVMQPP